MAPIERELLEFMSECRERLARIEQVNEGVRADLKKHAAEDLKTQQDVDELKTNVNKVKGALWTVSFMIGLPSLLLTLLKIMAS